MMNNSLRFEVFKRDGFMCQYCGKTPPAAVLEVDHVEPRSAGGSDDINNLVTACFDCNRGKAAKKLNDVPPGILSNIELIKEKELQVKEYNKLLARAEKRRLDSSLNISAVYNQYFPKYELSDEFIQTTIRRFLSALPEPTIIEAMHLACSMMINKHRSNPEDQSIKYFCGICWKKIRGEG